MRKTLLALAAVLLIAGGVSAQKVSGFKAMKAETGIVERQKTGVLKAEMPGKRKAPKKVQLADNEMIYGNYATDDIATNGIGLPKYPGKLMAATYLPITEGSKFNGATIKSIRFGLCCPVGASRVFIYPFYPDGSFGAALVSQDVENTVAGWNTVELTTPYVIDAKGLEAYVVGFEYTQVNTNDGQYYDDACFPLSFVNAGTAAWPTFVYGNLGQGTGWYNIGAESYGNLSVQCIVEKRKASHFTTFSLGICILYRLSSRASSFLMQPQYLAKARKLRQVSLWELLLTARKLRQFQMPIRLLKTTLWLSRECWTYLLTQQLESIMSHFM